MSVEINEPTYVVHKTLGTQEGANHHKALWCTTPNHHLVVAGTHPGVHQLVAHTHPGVRQLVDRPHPGVHSEALGVPGYHTPLMFLDTDIIGKYILVLDRDIFRLELDYRSIMHILVKVLSVSYTHLTLPTT